MAKKKISNKITAEQYRELVKKGIIESDKKGRLTTSELSNDYAALLDKSKNKKTPKYRNTKVVYKGMLFDSIKERDYYILYEFKKEKGEIKDFKWQVPITFKCKGEKMFDYVCDFILILNDGSKQYIDVKAFDKKEQKFIFTELFRIKRKCIEKQHNIKINLI